MSAKEALELVVLEPNDIYVHDNQDETHNDLGVEPIGDH